MLHLQIVSYVQTTAQKSSQVSFVHVVSNQDKVVSRHLTYRAEKTQRLLIYVHI